MGSYTCQRRQTSCVSGWIKFALLGAIFSFCIQGTLCDGEPTESQCRSYIEKALKEQHLEAEDQLPQELTEKELPSDQEEFPPTDEITYTTEGSLKNQEESNDVVDDEDEAEIKNDNEDEGDEDEASKTEDDVDDQEDIKAEEQDEDGGEEEQREEKEDELEGESKKDGVEEEDEEPVEDVDKAQEDEEEAPAASDDEEDGEDSNLEKPIDIEIHEIELDDDDDDNDEGERTDEKESDDEDVKENEGDEEKEVENENEGEEKKEVENENEGEEEKEVENENEGEEEKEVENENEGEEEKEVENEIEGEEEKQEDEQEEQEDVNEKDEELTDDDATKTEEDGNEAREEEKDEESEKIDEREGNEDDHKESATEEEDDIKEKKGDEEEEKETEKESSDKPDSAVEEKIEKDEANKQETEGGKEDEDEAKEGADEESPEEELINEMVIPDNLRPRDHIHKILRLEDSGVETILEKTIDTTLRALKGLYDNAIKPLEMLYKYRDLSNRHFGDPEIFSKPLILFMGPWSGGKSSTINYLLDNEFSHTSLRTGAEPSPAYFNILMHGEEEEILDGTQLAADWTFSGLQKFGQGLLDRLKGIKLPNKLLEKVNIVEIPGILEIRKQVQRLFPFNDACQWFIDRADIIFLVYDPSKLDVGPETEAILDQLKGREYQTRIILNKADQVKPEELMRVQGTLIWNISPLMSSSEPPIMYSTSLWSLPYEVGAPTRLLQAQERAFLKDLREAIDKRVENKISSARRFAVRVRNHAKMVDCYLTTYYNHKTIFGNRKKISDDIIEYPQKYHIYEGLSTLTNISRYDLPDPDVYRDFFKINPLYEFKKLSETCTYFRGCPINKLDVAIAYDLPELVGKYKKAVDTAKEQLQKENS